MFLRSTRYTKVRARQKLKTRVEEIEATYKLQSLTKYKSFFDFSVEVLRVFHEKLSYK